MSSLQRYLDNVVAEDSWGHPNWNEWAATLFDELVSCVESLEERVETLTEAHDAAQPEPAQTYGDKRGAYAEQPTETSDGWLAECEAKLASYMADDELRKWVVKYSKRLIAAAREGAMQTSQAYEQIVQLNKSLAAKEADLAAAATREEEAVGALSRLRSLLAAANAKAERLERERALPANAQAEKDLRKAEDILANVVDCIRGRITHRDPRDKREQLLWFASELKRAAEEIGALLEERW